MASWWHCGGVTVALSWHCGGALVPLLTVESLWIVIESGPCVTVLNTWTGGEREFI